MGRAIPATLTLPDSYTATTNAFPVLYLLHGAGGSYKGFGAQPEVAALADQYGIIIVAPDGGRTSWYFDSPIDPSYPYETFVAQECVAFMDSQYRTQADRHHRALPGFSRGGHGALFLGIRHRDPFGTAVSLSGGVDIRPFPNNWSLKKRIGDIEAYPDNWEKYTVINVAKDLKPDELNLAMEVGQQDFFLDVNRALHTQLNATGIKHNYTESPGRHNWTFCRAALKRQMPFIAEHIK